MNGQQRIGVFSALAGAALMLGAMISPTRATANGGDDGHRDVHKVTICHAVSGKGETKNGYNIITVDVNSVISDGHTTHTHHDRHDIIPAFDYTDHGHVKHYAGLGDASWIATRCAPPVVTTTTAEATTTTVEATTTTVEETTTTVEETTTTVEETTTTAEATTTTAAATTTTVKENEKEKETTTTAVAQEVPTPTVTTVPSVVTTAVLADSGALPTTGSSVNTGMMALALALLGSGLALVVLARRPAAE